MSGGNEGAVVVMIANNNGYFLKGKLSFIINGKGKAAKRRSQVNFERETRLVMTQRHYQRQIKLGLHSK